MKMRKLLAMLLTLSMVMSLAAPAFAEGEDGSSDDGPSVSESAEGGESGDAGSETGGGSQPTEPENPGDGSQPTEPENPGDGSQPTQPENPGDGSQPTQPENPGDGSQPAQPENPGDGSQPTQPENPGDGSQPAQPENPGDGSQPAHPENPGDGSQTGGNEENKDPVDPNAPVTPENPQEKPTEPVVPEKPPVNVNDMVDSALKGTASQIKNLLDSMLDQLSPEQIAQLQAKLAELDQPVVPVTGSLYDRLMAAATMEEFDAVLAEYSEEDALAEVEALGEEARAALEAHLNALYMASYEPPVSVSFTDAGPLLPAVEVETTYRAPRRARMANNSQNDKIQTSKTLEDWNSETKTGTLKIEAYVTGKYSVTEVTDAKPVDIVLVLDQSGSMSDTFSNGISRQQALKNALLGTGTGSSHVDGFIDKVAKSYSNQADHRMAIVTFGSQGYEKQLCGWTSLENKTALTNAVNNLPNSISNQATRVDLGVQEAEKLMGSGYSYSGTNTERKKVVIVFTDGVPTFTGSAFNVTVANNAINSAKHMKDAGVSVYTIGIFQGVNPHQLYDETQCTGIVNSGWQAKWNIIQGGDVGTADIPAGNRFLNYLSTNCPDATNVGLDRETEGLGIFRETVKYKITQNFERKASDYYLTASNTSELDAMFESINNQIGQGGTTIQLNEQSVVRDVISPYFEVNTAVTGGLKAYGVRYNGESFNEGETTQSYLVTPEGQVIDATGFNFNEKYIADTGRDPNGVEATGNYFGEKLVIEIPIKAKDGFWGGNNVPTNEMDKSGVFMKPDSEKKEAGLGASSPTANVQLKDFSVEGIETNIYYGYNGAIAPETMAQITDTIPDDWSTAYINRTPVMSAAGGIDRTKDSPYTIEVTLSPSQPNGDHSEGTPAQPVTKTAQAHVYVYTPTVWFKDMRTYLTVKADVENHQPADVKWFHNGTEAVPASMTGSAPTLYYNIVGRLNLENGPGTNQYLFDYYAKVLNVYTDASKTAEIPSAKVKFEHDPCDGITTPAGFDPDKNCQFIVHVFKPEVTFQDTTKYKGEDVMDADAYTAADYVASELKWVYHNGEQGGTVYADSSMGTAPNLTFTYETEESSLDRSLYVKDAPVKVSAVHTTGAQVSYNGDVIAQTTFKWQANSKTNSEGCSETCADPNHAYQFTVHVLPCTLTVSKSVTGMEGYNHSGDSFVFTIVGDDTNALSEAVNIQVVLKDKETKTITGLPVGNYTVSEQSGWAWRYQLGAGSDVNLVTTHTGSASITNQVTKDQWLSDDNSNQNIFENFEAAAARIKAYSLGDIILPENELDQ